MSPFKILLSVTVLLSFQTIMSQAYASGDDDRRTTQSLSIRSGDDEHDDDRSMRSTQAKEQMKKLLEQKKKRELEKKKRKTRNSSGTTLPVKPVTQSGSTQTGTTQTGNAQTPSTKTATVNYNTPDGMVPVVFSVTVNNGIVTAASSTKQAGGTSGYYQDIFAAGVSNATVGKKVVGLNLSAVGGASLTTNAFVKYVTANF